MLKFDMGRSWRATLVVCGLVLVGAAQAGAAPLMPFKSADLLARSGEPFARTAMPIPRSNELSEKWRGVEREIDDELLVLALCEEDRSRCSSPAAGRFLDIIASGQAHEGRARLGYINRAVNLAIKPASDETLYGEADVWRAPLALLEVGAGDCEDYAIAKFVALRAAGVAADDLRLVIMHDALRHEDHAVATVRLDGHWLLLDNRRMAMVEDVSLLNYQPLFVIDVQGVRQYRDAPLMAGVQQRKVEPAELLKLALRVR